MVNLKGTADDILEQEESVVSSTENTPVKPSKSNKAKKGVLSLSRQLSSGHKNFKIMSDMTDESTSGTVAETSKSTPSSTASIRAATNKARQMFSKLDPDPLSSSETVSDEDDYDASFKLLKAMEEIKKLKKQLQKSSGNIYMHVFIGEWPHTVERYIVCTYRRRDWDGGIGQPWPLTFMMVLAWESIPQMMGLLVE